MSNKLRALIVDDEGPARRWLKELLAVHPEIAIVAEADSVESARAVLQNECVDVIFLDVQMPPDTGFEVLPHVAAGTRIIFVTAYDSFAVKAFEANALDYLLKPVHPARLAETVRRLSAALLNNAEADRGELVPEEQKITKSNSRFSLMKSRLELDDLLPLRDRDLLRMVPVGKVAAIKAEGAYTWVIISGQPHMLVLQSISDWEERLPTPPFARLDRSRLLNLQQIQEAKIIDRDKTLVSLNGVSEPFELGRSAAQRLRELLR